MEEIWKPIEGYEDYYEVSNLGRVRSLDREYYTPNPRNPSLLMQKYVKGCILKPQGKKYLQVHLKVSGVRKAFDIHRLVAKAFIPNPDNLPEVNHIDENKHNNRADNLEWVSREGNVKHGTGIQRMGNAHKKAVIQLDLDGNVIATYPSQREAAKALGIKTTGINHAAKGKCPTYYGYRWKYADE